MNESATKQPSSSDGDPGSSPTGLLTASVVAAADSSNTTYAMFEVADLSADSGFLAGSILFEKGEELTLELARSGSEPVRIRARVVDLDRGSRPGMKVEFPGASAAEREALKALRGG